MTNKKTREITLGKDFGAVTITANGKRIEVSGSGNVKIKSANNKVASTKGVLEVGAHMKDGTVVIAVDLKKNIALFVPHDLLGSESNFDHQNSAVDEANEESLHGHKDWRRATNKEASNLAKDWNKIAPPERQGVGEGRSNAYRYSYKKVPIVRSGPARK